MAAALESSQNDLLQALSALHLHGRYSDLKIICNYREWAVHKAIVCSRSGFFDGACSSSMREAGTGVIDLSEDDEDAVEQMIHYFYHLDYDVQQPAEQERQAVFRHRALSDARRRLPKKLDLTQIEDPLLAQAGFYAPKPERPITPPESSPARHDSFDFYGKHPMSPKRTTRTPPLDPEVESESESSEDEVEYEDDESHLLLHARVYALAEKYDIPTLKSLAKRKFEIACACHYDSPDFADAIEEVYCSTIDHDRGLRDVVLQAFRTHPRLATTQDIYNVIKVTPSLAFELFKIERGLPI